MASGDLVRLGFTFETETFQWQPGISLISVTDSPTWAVEAADKWAELLLPSYLALLSDQVRFDNVTIYDKRPGTDLEHHRTYGTTHFGLKTDHILPLSLAAVMQWKTPVKRKWGLGRTFLAGMTVSALGDSQAWSATFHAAVANLAESHLTVFGSGGLFGSAYLCVVTKRAFNINWNPPIGLNVTATAARRTYSQVRQRVRGTG